MSKMKTLINNIKTFLDAGIIVGDIHANTVIKGLQNEPWQLADSEYPYITLDDGGERTELNDSQDAQTRFYSVIIEIGCYSLENISAAMDDCFDLLDEMKSEIEKEKNRQLDGFVWGISSTPFTWTDESKFFRGRQIIIEWYELEDSIFRY